MFIVKTLKRTKLGLLKNLGLIQINLKPTRICFWKAFFEPWMQKLCLLFGLTVLLHVRTEWWTERDESREGEEQGQWSISCRWLWRGVSLLQPQFVRTEDRSRSQQPCSDLYVSRRNSRNLQFCFVLWCYYSKFLLFGVLITWEHKKFAVWLLWCYFEEFYSLVFWCH